MGFYGLKRQRDACWKQAGRRGSFTSVRGSVENSSTKHTLRIPKKSEVRRTYLCLRFNKEIILQPKFIALIINLHCLIEFRLLQLSASFYCVVTWSRYGKCILELIHCNRWVVCWCQFREQLKGKAFVTEREGRGNFVCVDWSEGVRVILLFSYCLVEVRVISFYHFVFHYSCCLVE